MSRSKITKNFKKFKRVEERANFKTRVSKDMYNNGVLDRSKLLPLVVFGNKRDEKKSVIATKEIFTENVKYIRSILSEEVINKLSPNNIDINYFWKKSVESFPFMSICGYADANTPDEANTATMQIHHSYKGIGAIQHFYEINGGSLTMLEIGPGYGNIHEYVNSIPNVNYYAIDVNPLFKCDTLYKCDGKNIPPQIPSNIDLVYSINVFQHLSREQRLSYYKQVFLILKPGGGFIFSMFALTPRNYNMPIWGCSDEKGNFYTMFFNQFTIVEWVQNIKKDLEEIGFEFHHICEQENSCSFLAIKPQGV